MGRLGSLGHTLHAAGLTHGNHSSLPATIIVCNLGAPCDVSGLLRFCQGLLTTPPGGNVSIGSKELQLRAEGRVAKTTEILISPKALTVWQCSRCQVPHMSRSTLAVPLTELHLPHLT